MKGEIHLEILEVFSPLRLPVAGRATSPVTARWVSRGIRMHLHPVRRGIARAPVLLLLVFATHLALPALEVARLTAVLQPSDRVDQMLICTGRRTVRGMASHRVHRSLQGLCAEWPSTTVNRHPTACKKMGIMAKQRREACSPCAVGDVCCWSTLDATLSALDNDHDP